MDLNRKLEAVSRALADPSRVILHRASAEICALDAAEQFLTGRRGLADACIERAADYIFGRFMRPEGWDD